jgi:Helix-turn-helix domain
LGAFSLTSENGPVTRVASALRPRALKARDAGKYIGVGRTKLKELIASGAFPGAYRIGRDHVVPVVDLDAFVDAQAAAARALFNERTRHYPPLSIAPSPAIFQLVGTMMRTARRGFLKCRHTRCRNPFGKSPFDPRR